jgi:hypothetical protein
MVKNIIDANRKNTNSREEEKAIGLFCSESIGIAETDALIPVREVSSELFA